MRLLRLTTAPILLGLVLALPLAGQTRKNSQNSGASASQASSVPLNTDLTVQGNVTAQAVLIPRRIAKAVFGGKIAKEYAVVQLTINNKSSDAALIVQGVYIDYSKWALAGGGFSKLPCTEEGGADPKSKFVDCSKPAQVSSEEYRVVRGQALNAQTWTWRNGIVRGLVLAGTIATGLSFTASAGEKEYSQAVAAFNGTLVPGVSTFWPDQTIDQINRISDLGYQTNKVISKQGSDIIVCFFPIDRFLTNGFKQLFLDEPALFFAPYEMLVDRNAQKKVLKVVPPSFFGTKPDFDKMTRQLGCYMKIKRIENDLESGNDKQSESVSQLEETAKTQAECSIDSDVFLALDSLAGVSLNTIHVVVDGVMSVDTTTMQAKLDEVVIDKERDSKTWTAPVGGSATVTGTITGSYLTGGTPIIQEAKADKITSVKVITDGSNDQTLKFSFDLGQTLKPGDHLTFVVEKGTKDSKTAPVESAPFQYAVP